MDDLPTVCYACGRKGVLGDGPRCPCGEPRWLATDAGDFQWPAATGRTGRDGHLASSNLWRYADLLPVGSEHGAAGVAAAVGATPLYRTPRLDEYAGCRVHLKDETATPTGSFKDRGSAVGVAAAAAAGRERVGTVSHGNMARSVAAMAAGRGLSCVVLVPEDVPEDRLAPIARYGPTIVRVRGDYGRLYRESLAVERDIGVPFLNSDVPLRVAGQKTVAYEVVETFARTEEPSRVSAPDAVVLPVSSGGNAGAVWKGLRELRTAGLLDALPRLYLTQAAACDPVARAYRRGDERVSPLSDDEVAATAAYSIANADPPSGTRALAAVRATGGAAVSVPDGEILDAQVALAERAGVAVEPASATALAGLRQLAVDGEVGPDEDVVVVATGAAVGAGADAPAPEVVPLSDLRERLRSPA